VYDGDGGRLQQIDHTGEDPLTTTYTNDIIGLSQVLVSDDGTTTTHNLFGLDLISQDDGTTTRYLLADGLGSVRVEMVNGAVETTTTYEPYGKLLAQTGSSGTTYGFTGEQYDAATGLVYLRTRYYNPALQMFMSADPWGGSIWRPATFNGYDYVGSNPINLGDPSGLDPWWCATDTNTLLSVPSYATQDAIGNCYRKHIGPPAPTDYSFAGSLAKNIPILGNLVQMGESLTVMNQVSSQPQYWAEQRAYGRWQVANCPMGCHISPDSIESQYGANVWLQRGQPKPTTPLMDTWGNALATLTLNAELLAADIFLAGIACQVKTTSNFIELYAYRGTGRTYPNEPTLVRIGHVGVSLDGGQTIYGFHPTGEAIAVLEQQGVDIENFLFQRGAMQGGVFDDTAVFLRANELAHEGSRSQVWRQSIPVSEAEFYRIQNQILTQAVEGSPYPSWYRLPSPTGSSMPFQCNNCATWPRTLNLAIPEESGNLLSYLEAIQNAGATPWRP
jgi:RHS repeat-associated protein